MSFVNFVSSHEEASAGGGSIVPQGGIIVQQNLATLVSKTTCLEISTHLSSGWFYQDHRWSFFCFMSLFHVNLCICGYRCTPPREGCDGYPCIGIVLQQAAISCGITRIRNCVARG